MEKRSRVCFRQRHGGGRCIPAPFQPSLRLHFILPPAEPLTEAVPSRTQPALRRTFTSRLKFAAPSANSRQTILRQNRRKKPAHAAKLPALSSDAKRVANRPKQLEQTCSVREQTRLKTEYYLMSHCWCKLAGKKAIDPVARRKRKHPQNKCCSWPCYQFR